MSPSQQYMMMFMVGGKATQQVSFMYMMMFMVGGKATQQVSFMFFVVSKQFKSCTFPCHLRVLLQ
jgi:hypothetical protein